MDALRRGDISVGVVVPPDFERRRFDGREAVQVLVDGSDTVVQAAAIQLAQLPLDTRPVANVKSERTGGGQIGVVSFYNPERRSRSEEHTSELQSLMRISYAVFCLKKKRT